MHSLWSAFAILALVYCAAGQDPLVVSITPASTGPVVVKIGDTPEPWICQLNRGVVFSMVGKMEWIHKSSDGTERVIAEDKNLVEEAKEHYTLNVTFDLNTYIKSELVIESVRAEDLGQWICRATQGDVVAEAMREVDIIHDLTEVSMQVGSAGPYTLEMTEGVQFDEGKYSVTCDIKGGNPQPTVQITLDGKDLQLEENSIRKPTTPLPSFHTIATATVDLAAAHMNKVLRCTGSVADFPSRSVAIKLDIKTFSPTIHCQNKTTSKGDKYVEADCVVSFVKPVKNVSLEVGETNTMIQANRDYGDGDTKFITQPVNATAMKVIIDVYEMKDKHFQHVYYVNVFGHDNKVYREPIIFINAGLNELSGASTVFQSLLSLTVCLAVLGLLQRLHW